MSEPDFPGLHRAGQADDTKATEPSVMSAP
jgi:hypothetical protein